MTSWHSPTRTLIEAAWRRHENPKSGWTRVAAYPLFFLALYRRDRRLLAATAAFVLVNPVLFPPPGDDDAWMTRVVRGERLWLAGGEKCRLLYWLHGANLAVTLYAVRAAFRRRPVRTALAVAGSMALKLLFAAAVAGYYDRYGDTEHRGSVTDAGDRDPQCY